MCEPGLADRLENVMGGGAPAPAPSLRDLHLIALKVKLMLEVLHATVDDRSLEELNIDLAEEAHRLACRLDKALDQAAG